MNLEEFEQLKKLSGQKITILELANLIKKFKLLIDNENTFISKSLFENNLFETFKSYLPYK